MDNPLYEDYILKEGLQMLKLRMIMLRFWIWKTTFRARLKDAIGLETTDFEEFLIETWLM